MKRILKNYRLYIVIICLLLFYVFLREVLNDEIKYIDNLGYQYIYTNLRSGWLTNFFCIVTSFIAPSVVVSIIITSYVTIKNKRIPIFMALNLTLVFLLNYVVKVLVVRPRPPYGLIIESGYSFPSAHSMVSLAFYGYIIWLCYKYLKNKTIKWIIICLLTLLIILIGLSRIYLGVHFGSDVIAGFLLSLSYLVIYISIVDDFIIKEKK